MNELGPFVRERAFFNVSNPPSLPAGGSQQATPGAEISIPVTQSPHGSLVVLYTSAEDSRLARPFAGVLLDEAIQIVHAMKSVAGLMLQSRREAALVVQKSSGDVVQTR